MDPDPSPDVRRRRRIYLAALRGAGWNRAAAQMRVRSAATAALESAAAEVRHGAHDDRVRALVDRAIRRLSLVADLEAESAIGEDAQSRRPHQGSPGTTRTAEGTERSRS